jgi:CheY-like chemotaxis protein
VKTGSVLIIDDDPSTNADLRRHFADAGITVDSATDGLHAMECLRDNSYCAVVLDPLIRERLNGYAVLSYIEMEQPATLARLFLLTGMSKQTIQRTAPLLVSRFFRKPHEGAKLAGAVVTTCAPDEPRGSRSASLLLVEDDHATGAALTVLLEGRGYAVTRAHDGTEALTALASVDFDVVLLDLILPGVDGFSVLERLRSGKPDLLRRVIVMTGMPEQYAREGDLGAVCGLLRKPIEVPELGRLLARCAPDCAFEGGGEVPSMS